MKNLQYFWYILRHKWYVFLACLRCKLYWRGLVHDLSKFRPSEWAPYRDYFYGPRPASKATIEAFERAWLLHQHRNPHHWQYWLLRRDDGAVSALRMPDDCVQEMVADWIGTGRAITGRIEVWSWYDSNKCTMKLHWETQRQVEDFLRIIRPPEPPVVLPSGKARRRRS